MPLSFVLSPRWLHKVNVLLIRTTSFPILLTIRFFQRHSFKKGLELTAEKASSWLPIPSTGKAELDVIERVFSLEHESNGNLTFEDAGEREAEEQLRSEDSPMEYGSALSDAKNKKKEKAKGVEEDVEEDQGLENQHTPRGSKQSRSSISSSINEGGFSDNPPLTPSTPNQPYSSSVRGRDNNVTRRAGGRRVEVSNPRGLGSLSSPLARLFGGGDRRSISPNFAQRIENNSMPNLHQHQDYAQPNAISKGTFRDDNQVQPHSEGMSYVPRELIDRLELIEKRSERIEVSQVQGD